MNTDWFEKYLIELLHINDSNNKMVNLLNTNTYLIKKEDFKGELSGYIYNLAKSKLGKIATLIISNSVDKSLSKSINFEGDNIMLSSYNSSFDLIKYKKYVEKIKIESLQNGNNQMFLSIGNIKYQTMKSNELVWLSSPLIIFPIKIVSNGVTAPDAIEFIDDDIYFNISLYHKLKQTNSVIANDFPLPIKDSNMSQFIDLDTFNLDAYFDEVEKYLSNFKNKEKEDIISFDKNLVAISNYKHEDLSMYFDCVRNKEKIINSELCNSVFGNLQLPVKTINKDISMVLPFDSAQEHIVKSVLKEENLEIKGPPGTGKTQTIANMISSLINQNKKVLFISKKNSALSEVYNKLPKELSNYIMMLNFETEAELKNLTPNMLHKQLRETLNHKSNSNIVQLKAQHELLNKNKNNALIELSKYDNEIFVDNDLLGSNLFEAFNIYLKDKSITDNLEELEGVDSLDYTRYLTLIDTFKKAINHLKVCTSDFNHTIIYNPWYNANFNNNIDDIINDSKNIKTKFDLIIKSTEELSEELCSIPLKEIIALVDNLLTIENVNEFINQENLFKYIEELNLILNTYLDNLENIVECKRIAPGFIGKTIQKSFTKILTDDLIYDEIINLRKYNFFNNLDAVKSENILEIKQLTNNFKNNFEASEESYINVLKFFVKSKIEEDRELFDKAQKSLIKYCDNDKVNFFDFKAKKLIKELQNYTYNKEPLNLSDLSYAILEYKKYCDLIQNNELIKRDIEFILTEELNVFSILFLNKILDSAKATTSLKVFLNDLKIEIDNLINVVDTGLFKNLKIDIKAINECIEYSNVYDTITSSLSNINLSFIKTDESFNILNSKINSLIVIAKLRDKFNFSVDKIFDIIKLSIKLDKECNLKESTAELFKLVDKHFSNSFYAYSVNININVMKIFSEHILNTSMAFAMKEFEQFIREIPEFDVRNFLRPFAIGLSNLHKTNDLFDIFNNLIYRKLINHKLKISKNKNIRLDRAKIEELFNTIYDCENSLFDINAKLIEVKCQSTINTSDRKHAYLTSETSRYKNSRIIFKEQAQSILELKKCFILSPSTISVMLRYDEYDTFDVAIIDEASQMLPEYLLPILFRVKQCVVVGDEWQMPPIKRFEVVVEDEGEDYEAVRSVIDLLKVNNSFSSAPLNSHFRSNTETLIAYSSKYYNNLVSFPGIDVEKDDEKTLLGLRNVYHEDGTCEDGVNTIEALEVVKQIENIFEKFYDEKTCKLTQSFGVVTFGKKQLEAVKKHIQQNTLLSEKISKATLNFEKNIEKLMFFQTIDNVQGQEADHIIISLTYGKNKDGNISLRFGEMNLNNVGEKMFNVAVTRSRNSLTMIHSILGHEIKANPRVAFIGEYIELIELLKNNKTLLTDAKTSQFELDVKQSLINIGIKEERIMFNYGVTKNSFTIPLVILDECCKTAKIAIFCERNIDKNILDFNIRYKKILKSRGWNIIDIFIHDWIYSNEYEVNLLSNKIKKLLEKEGN